MDLRTFRELLAAYAATGRVGIVLPAAELLAAIDQAEHDRADHVARLAYDVHLALIDHDLVKAEKGLRHLFHSVCVCRDAPAGAALTKEGPSLPQEKR